MDHASTRVCTCGDLLLPLVLLGSTARRFNIFRTADWNLLRFFHSDFPWAPAVFCRALRESVIGQRETRCIGAFYGNFWNESKQRVTLTSKICVGCGCTLSQSICILSIGDLRRTIRLLHLKAVLRNLRWAISRRCPLLN